VLSAAGKLSCNKTALGIIIVNITHGSKDHGG